MRNRCLLLWVIIALSQVHALGDVGFGTTTVTYSSTEDGKKLLMEQDDFVKALSPFDRAARLKTDAQVTEKDFLKFVGDSVQGWTEQEKTRVDAALDAIRPRLEAMSLPFPKTIIFVKTTGAEEGHAAYTRGAAIILPQTDLRGNASRLSGLIAHELFHVLSRANPDLRDKLYAAIGFIRCNEVELPAALRARKITNPDAPRNDHCIQLTINGQKVWAVPILLSTSEIYDVARRQEFFAYLNFKFLLVQRDQGTQVKPLFEGTEPRLAGLNDVSGFYEQVGRNTDYIIHPEEILADNFKLLVLGENAPSVEVLDKLRAVFVAAGKDVGR